MNSLFDKKNIFLIGCLLAAFGLINNVASLFFTQVGIPYFSVLDMVNFRSPMPQAYGSINVPEVLFYLFFAFGLYAYNKTGEDHKGILKFCFSIICISTILSLATYFLSVYNSYMIHDIKPAGVRLDGDFSFVSYLWRFPLFIIPKLLMLWYVIKLKPHLFSAREVKSEASSHYKNKGELVSIPVSRWTRLGHRILDFYLAILLATGLMSTVYMSINLLFSGQFRPFELSRNFSNNYAISIVSFIVGIMFYLAFAVVYKITPAKFLSRCLVVDVNTLKPIKLGKAVGRSFARYIPFEPLSFLGGRDGWHDSLSNSRVSRLKGFDKGLRTHWVFILLFLLSPFFQSLYNKGVEYLEERKQDKFYEEMRERDMDAKIARVETSKQLINVRIASQPNSKLLYESRSNDSLSFSLYFFDWRAANKVNYNNISEKAEKVIAGLKVEENEFYKALKTRGSANFIHTDTTYKMHNLEIKEYGIPDLTFSHRRSTTEGEFKVFSTFSDWEGEALVIDGLETIKGDFSMSNMPVSSQSVGDEKNSIRCTLKLPVDQERAEARLKGTTASSQKVSYIIAAYQRNLYIYLE